MQNSEENHGVTFQSYLVLGFQIVYGNLNIQRSGIVVVVIFLDGPTRCSNVGKCA